MRALPIIVIPAKAGIQFCFFLSSPDYNSRGQALSAAKDLAGSALKLRSMRLRACQILLTP